MESREQNNFLKSFGFEGASQPIEYVETMNVVEGVKCDVYKFTGDNSKDLGIIKIELGCKTPLQKVLKGERTVEGYISGSGKLVIYRVGGKEDVYEVGNDGVNVLSVNVETGDIMQWQASRKESLIAYEICFPPYEDGRYENL